MKPFLRSVVLLLLTMRADAGSTIDPAAAYAWGANVGWINWRGDVGSGAVIGEYVSSGYVWAANVGWINLGDGTPAMASSMRMPTARTSA